MKCRQYVIVADVLAGLSHRIILLADVSVGARGYCHRLAHPAHHVQCALVLNAYVGKHVLGFQRIILPSPIPVPVTISATWVLRHMFGAM
jgi:hypothetical protein